MILRVLGFLVALLLAGGLGWVFVGRPVWALVRQIPAYRAWARRREIARRREEVQIRGEEADLREKEARILSRETRAETVEDEALGLRPGAKGDRS